MSGTTGMARFSVWAPEYTNGNWEAVVGKEGEGERRFFSLLINSRYIRAKCSMIAKKFCDKILKTMMKFFEKIIYPKNCQRPLFLF